MGTELTYELSKTETGWTAKLIAVSTQSVAVMDHLGQSWTAPTSSGAISLSLNEQALSSAKKYGGFGLHASYTGLEPEEALAPPPEPPKKKPTRRRKTAATTPAPTKEKSE